MAFRYPTHLHQYANNDNQANVTKQSEAFFNKLYAGKCVVSKETRSKESSIKDQLLECIKKKQTELKNKSENLSSLEKKAKQCPLIQESQTVVSGSRAKGLAIEEADYDLLVCLSSRKEQQYAMHGSQYRISFEDVQGRTTIEANKVLTSFISLIQCAVDPKVRVVRTAVSAEVSGFQGLPFDLLPAYRCSKTGSADFFVIPSRKDKEDWEDSHRREELEIVQQCKQNFPEFTKSVRILKWFRDTEELDISSYPFQLLVAKFKGYQSDCPLTDSIKFCLDLLKSALQGEVQIHDPFANRDLLAKFTKPKKAAAKQKILDWIDKLQKEISQPDTLYHYLE